jgi:hypothetical protein
MPTFTIFPASLDLDDPDGAGAATNLNSDDGAGSTISCNDNEVSERYTPTIPAVPSSAIITNVSLSLKGRGTDVTEDMTGKLGVYIGGTYSWSPAKNWGHTVEVNHTYDVTAARPGGGNWTMADFLTGTTKLALYKDLGVNNGGWFTYMVLTATYYVPPVGSSCLVDN